MKIKTYIGKNIRFKFNDDYNSPSLLYILCVLLQNGMLIDRFGFFDNTEWNNYTLQTNIDEIYNLPHLSLQETFTERTNQFINMNKPIYLSLSGGVDSTAMLSAFIRNKNLNKNLFYCLYDDATIFEYPKLIDYIKNENINTVEVSHSTQDLLSYSNNGIYIAGFGGDEVEGKCYDKFCVEDDWKEWLKKTIKTQNKSMDRFDEYVSQIEKFLNYCHIPLNVPACTVRATIDFNLKYYTNLSVVKSISDTPDNVYMFYDTPQFQKYFFDNIVTKPKKELLVYSGSLYKSNYKKLIYIWNRDSKYLSKGKGNTFKFGYSVKNNEVFVRDDEGNKKFYKSNVKEIENYFLDNYIKEDYKEFFYFHHSNEN